MPEPARRPSPHAAGLTRQPDVALARAASPGQTRRMSEAAVSATSSSAFLQPAPVLPLRLSVSGLPLSIDPGPTHRCR